MDDLDLSRYRREERDRSDPGRESLKGRAFLGRVVTASPAVGKFMKVMPRGLLGVEAEGAAGSASDLGTVPLEVYLAGPGVPATNDEVVCRFVDYRWVATRRKPATQPPPAGIPVICSGVTHYIPTTLNLSVPDGGPAQVGSGGCYVPDGCGVVLGTRFTAPNGNVCCYTSQTRSGSFTYGPPPAAVASLFAAGYQAWFNPTPFASTYSAGCNTSTYNQYEYIVDFPGPCAFGLGDAFVDVSDGDGPQPSYVNQPVVTWQMTTSGDTFSPFYAVYSGTPGCPWTLTG